MGQRHVLYGTCWRVIRSSSPFMTLQQKVPARGLVFFICKFLKLHLKNCLLYRMMALVCAANFFGVERTVVAVILRDKICDLIWHRGMTGFEGFPCRQEHKSWHKILLKSSAVQTLSAIGEWVATKTASVPVAWCLSRKSEMGKQYSFKCRRSGSCSSNLSRLLALAGHPPSDSFYTVSGFLQHCASWSRNSRICSKQNCHLVLISTRWTRGASLFKVFLANCASGNYGESTGRKARGEGHLSLAMLPLSWCLH